MTDALVSAGDLAARLRPLVLAATDGNGGYGSSCLQGTPMIPLHRATVTSIYLHLEQMAEAERADSGHE